MRDCSYSIYHWCWSEVFHRLESECNMEESQLKRIHQRSPICLRAPFVLQRVHIHSLMLSNCTSVRTLRTSQVRIHNKNCKSLTLQLVRRKAFPHSSPLAVWLLISLECHLRNWSRYPIGSRHPIYNQLRKGWFWLVSGIEIVLILNAQINIITTAVFFSLTGWAVICIARSWGGGWSRAISAAVHRSNLWPGVSLGSRATWLGTWAPSSPWGPCARDWN